MAKVSQFQYVGMHFQTDSKDMFTQQYKVNVEKAVRMSSMCLAVNRMVGSPPTWDARTLYMARVDPYLTAGCEVSLDVVDAHLESLEKVQHQHLRRILGLGAKSMVAVLFSETGIWPIRYRRATLALKYLRYLVQLPHERLAWCAITDSLNLAKDGQISWINDMRLVLAKLPVPVLWNLPRSQIDTDIVDGLIANVKKSMEMWVQDAIDKSTKTRDLLRNRLEMDNGTLVTKVLDFRHYLRVLNPRHRIALTHIILSGHQLAIERMRWQERYIPSIPECWRLCRFCKTFIEDAVHALLVCTHPPLRNIRHTFFSLLDVTLPGVRLAQTDPGLLLRHLISQRAVTALLAKLAYDILEIFYAEPMLKINPLLST